MELCSPEELEPEPIRLSLDLLFGSGCVLQNGPSVEIWGKAAPGSPVQLNLEESVARATSDETGSWQTSIVPPPMGGPYSILVTSGKEKVISENVLVGDVWICSGQSNMEWTLGQIPSLVHFRDEASLNIRFIRPGADWSDEPLTHFEHGAWNETEGLASAGCTAIGYAFARHIQKHLGDRPIGLIANALGGSFIEAWIPKERLLETPEWRRREPLWLESWQQILEHNQKKLDWAKRWFDESKDNHTKRVVSSKPPSHDNTWFCTGNQPGALFNSLLHPLKDLSCSGVLWYQGESNCDLSDDYEALYKLMVACWRETMAKPDLPIYHVQLAGWQPWIELDKGREGIPRTDGWPGLRAAQAKARHLPNCAMASAIDVGHRYDIHPPAKDVVGERLARIALNRHYGIPMIDTGPELIAAHATEQGVVVKTTQSNDLHTSDESETVKGFMTLSENEWTQADATLVASGSGKNILLSGQNISEVAYASCSWQEVNLCGSDGLPALPGRLSLC